MLEGFEPIVIDNFGGIAPLVDRVDLPMGVAIDAENVQFFPGGVKTRPGLDSLITIPGEVSIDGYWAVYDHVDGRSLRSQIVLRGGNGYIKGRPEGSLAGAPSVSIVDNIGFNPAFTTMKSASLYGRAFFCVSDGKRGLVPPVMLGAENIPGNVSAAGGHEALINWGIGNMVGGRYYIAVAYETRTGHITGSVKLNYDTAPDLSALQLTSIPIGPPGTVKRRIFISLVDSFELFNPVGLVIDDNTSTSAGPFDLTQAEIAEGLPFADYINRTPPSAHLGVVAYNNRLVMWGGDGKIKSFFGPTITGINPTYSSIGLINLDFSADAAAAYNWAVAGEYVEWYGASGLASVVAGSAAEGEFSNYLRLESAGGASDALIRQGYSTLRGNRDKLGNYYLQPSRKFGIRMRIRRSPGAVAGDAVVRLYENNALASSTLLAEARVPMASIGTTWQIVEFDGTVATTSQPHVSMTVHLDSVTNAQTVNISRIEVYDNEYKSGRSFLNVSSVDDPEAFDVVTGVVPVNINDGEDIRNVFVLHGNLYVCKEDSLYVVSDSGEEPAFWPVEKVSGSVGTLSVHGVAVGDNFALIASRDGLYLFTGGAPEKISHEIKPLWESFDWDNGHKIFCTVNPSTKTFVVGGLDESGVYMQLRMNYEMGFGDPLGGGESSRKWSVDTRRVTDGLILRNGLFAHASVIVRDDGEKVIAFASPDLASVVAIEDETAAADYSGDILPVYETAMIGQPTGRTLYGGVILRIIGDGSLSSSFVRYDGSAITLATKALSASTPHELEIRTHASSAMASYRMAVERTAAPPAGKTPWFTMQRITVFTKPHPGARHRGY